MALIDLDDALKTISNRPELARFVGPASEDLVSRAEALLGVVLPPTYRRFLRTLGAGSFGSFDFYGIVSEALERRGVPNGIWYTLDERKTGLPKTYVVFAADGMGGLYCIDCSETGREGNVVVFVPGAGTQSPEIVATDFGAFMKSMVNDQVSEG